MKRPFLFRSALVGGYFAASFMFLYWWAGTSSFCSRRGASGSTFRLACASTIVDLLACMVGFWLTNNVIKLRTAAPLVAGVLTGVVQASVPFWIYRGYGHYIFEETWADVSCFFTEQNGMVYPFIVAPIMAVLSLIHGILLLRSR